MIGNKMGTSLTFIFVIIACLGSVLAQYLGRGYLPGASSDPLPYPYPHDDQSHSHNPIHEEYHSPALLPNTNSHANNRHRRQNNAIPPSPRVAEPPTVRDVRVTYSSADEVRLDWNTTPENVEEIVYHIRIKAERMSGGENPGTTILPFRTSVKNATIRPLSPYNNYTALVYAYSKTTKMHGAAGKVVFQTNATAPSVVKDLKILDADVDKNVIYLTWGPPDPANGEIESYEVRAVNDDQAAEKKFSFSKEKTQYEVTLPSNVNANPIEIQVYAVNKGVPEPGAISDVCFNPFWWFQELGRPLNFTAQSVGHGMVNLEWAHPSNSFVEITKFYIEIQINKTNLLEPNKSKIPIIEHPAKKKEKVYFRCLDLQTSTSYEIYLTASTSNNSKSPPVGKYVSVSDGYAFAGAKKLRVVKNGTLLEIRVPKVENATQSTNVSIIFKGFARCGTTQQQSGPEEWVLQDYQPVKNEPKNFTFNPDKGIGENCFPILEQMYEIKAVIKNDSEIVDNLNWFSATMNQDKKQNLTWLIIFPIITAICLIPVCIWYRKCRKSAKNIRQPSYLEVLPPLTTPMTSYELMSAKNATSSTAHPGPSETQSSAHLYWLPNEPDSRAVSLKYFEEYAKDAAASDLLYSQFMLLPRGMTKSCEYGSLPENIPKNRYKNQIAYDDTRVVLKKLSGDQFSDYINASYIKGFRKEKAYIATQGPKPNTINDFWRLIWQEDVRVICMMSNLVEGNTRMSEKYWPDLGSRMKFGNFLVSTTNNQVFADFTFRTFRLSCERDTREVTHLQYTGWPILGVPSPQSFVAYLKKLIQTPAGNGPVVVHCHAGDGRTGVLILSDICLHQAIGENTIDVTAVATRMRDSRTNMVATPQQFLFAHVIIVEGLVSIPTQIPCNEDLPSRIQKMRLQLKADLQRLHDTMWQEQALLSFATEDPADADYITIDELAQVSEISGVPGSEQSQTFEAIRSSLNVVSVDGLKLKNQYLASWLPPPLTLSNFWEFVVERNIHLIIILQCSDPKNPTCCDIIPDKLILPSMPHLMVESKTVPERDEYFATEKLRLTDSSERITRSQTVTVLTCGGWEAGRFGKPPPPVALVSLWRASEKISRKEGETLVLCHDGNSGCSLYLSMSFLLERMTVEGECDVISAVRTVRKANPEFVYSKEQCEYLYDAAEIYAEYFKCYANFK